MTPQLSELPVPRATLGEGPCWEPVEGALYWTDIPAHKVHRLAADGTHATTAAGPGTCGGALFACQPGATGLPANPFRG